ncbi:LCP family protein [Fodinibacter luteus]|uniref:LCP family protein n=1 Tax=Fodinibacter luteus TaxID=552064 RepID=A0ABP8KNP3_9MICO
MPEDPVTPPRPSRRRRLVAGLGVLGVVLVAVLGLVWWRLEGNIDRLDVSDDLGDRPAVAEGPLNILLIGSDTREGQDVAGESLTEGARSDTTLVAHVSADREHVTVVSVPRDSMVPAPRECDAAAPREEWVDQQWNSLFTVGGPACLIATLEGATGLFVNHFAVVDFRGFRDMVDALGGVPVCTNEPIDDPKAKLTLAAGRHVLDGEQALGYVRARQTLGDGSDLGRIERQQAFLSSVVQEATRTSLLLRPDRLFAFLDAATRSLTTDPEFGTGTMRDLATSVKDIGIGNVQFVTVPVQEYEADPNRVAWAPEAEALWETLREDGVLGAQPTPGTTSTAPSPSSTTSAPSASPSASTGGSPSASPGGSPSPTITTRSADDDICS